MIEEWKNGRSKCESKTTGFGAYSRALIFILTFFLITFNAGCCIRWSLDSIENPVEIIQTGKGNFILELYQYRDFDARHDEVGRHFITITNTCGHPVPKNYVRSFIYQAAAGSKIEFVFDNGERAVGIATAQQGRTLKVPNIFRTSAGWGPQVNNSIKKLGFNPKCRIGRIVINNVINP